MSVRKNQVLACNLLDGRIIVLFEGVNAEYYQTWFDQEFTYLGRFQRCERGTVSEFS